jgi:hypothetical protein
MPKRSEEKLPSVPWLVGRRRTSQLVEYGRNLRFEPLEDRRLLAVWPMRPAVGHAAPTDILVGAAAPDASPSTSQLVPEQVREAYGLDAYNASGAVTNNISFGGVAGTGAGQTIAIVDAYDDPDAVSDLATFSSTYGLPAFGGSGPAFQQLTENGNAVSRTVGNSNYVPPDPSGELNGSNNDWELEESLDIEWAHAMAPLANIDLFEATTASYTDLNTAVQYAAATTGVVAVSMSWGGSETSQTLSDSIFITPSGHLDSDNILGGITFLAAAGDSGAYAANTSSISPQYPADSPNVVAVGGTTLTVNQNGAEYSYGGETSWGNNTSSGTAGGGGGGVSVGEAQPSYQALIVHSTQSAVVSSTYSSNNGQYSSPHRTYPDVSADAAGSVLVFDSYSTAGNEWAVEGTSLACPLWAGMIAVADQGRSIEKLGSLYGNSQTLPELYTLATGSSYSTFFNDVNTGNANGPPSATTNPRAPSYSPSANYDPTYNLATGLGSPKAAALIPQLVGPAQLAFGQAPTTTGANAVISPAVTVLVEDSLGNVVASDSSSVTLSIGTNPSGGTLSGTLTATAVNGVATFSNLAINNSGVGYTLIASDTTGPGPLTATSSPFNISAPPSVATPAAATPNPVTGTSTSLSVLGADNGGEANLTYSWSATTLPAGASAPSFSANGTNAAKNSTATFSKAGNYVLTATITNPSGSSTTSSVSVTVNQTATSVTVTPAVAVLTQGATQQFTATEVDQFGAAMTTQPTFNWSATAGSISASGLFTMGSAAATITATGGGFTGTAQATVDQPPTVATAAAASPSPVTGTTTALSVLGAYIGGEQNLTYTWSTTGTPPSAVTFSANGTNAAKGTTATFSAAGTYSFQVVIADPFGASVTSNVTVTVVSTISFINLSPGSSTIPTGGQQQFTATATDQFGNTISPPALNWTATAGSISASGLYNAAATAGNVTVTAASGSVNSSVTLALAAPSSWWKFDDGTGTTAADSSGNGHNGTVNGATWTTGRFGDALQFNGSSSTVTASAVLSGSTDFTLGAWVKTSASSTGVIVQQRGGGTGQFQLVVNSDGTVTFWVGRNGTSNFQFDITSSNSINDGNWHYVAAVRQGASGYLYVDGVEVGSGAGSERSLSSIDGVSIGGDSYSSRYYFSGLIDDVRIYASPISSNGIVSLSSNPPTIATAAAASPSPVTGTTTGLSVLGADPSGESTLTYTWTTTGTPPAAVAFSANGSNAAKVTTATFSAPGTYSFLVTAVDAFGLAATSSVNVTVNQTLTTIVVSPASAGLNAAATETFTAKAYDQFGAALTAAAFTWTTNVGTITSPGGLLTASNSSVTGKVTASSGGVSGSSAVTVTDHPPTVAISAAATPSVVNGTTTSLSAQGGDVDTGPGSLTYTWATTGTPPAAVTFAAVNGTNAGQVTSATFSAAGTYQFTVTIADPGGMSVTSNVSVTVNQTLSSIAVSPASVSLNAGATEQFAATAVDQFGTALAHQPSFAWTTTVGSIASPGGLLTASSHSVAGTVTATSGAVSGTSSVTVTDSPPTFTTPAAATPSVVNGTTTTLTAQATDIDTAPGNLIYTWATTGTPPAPVTFASVNGTNAGQSTLATFSAAGNYSFTVTVTDPGAMTATSSVSVTVNQTLTSITVNPASAGLNAAATQPFTATAYDQFGVALATQPSFSWTSSVGSITSSGGLLTASNSSVTGTVTATSGAISGRSAVTVTDNPPTVTVPATATPGAVTGTATNLTAQGADVDTGSGSLTYTWATTGTPPAAVTFSGANGTSAGQNTLATFSAAGTYSFMVTIADPGGMTVTSSVTVTVNQTLTSISVVPASTGLTASGTQPFVATGFDQFSNPLSTQPSFAWSVVGAGAIDSNGNYTPAYTAGSATIVAATASVSGGYTVTLPGVAQFSAANTASWSNPNTWTGSVSGQTEVEPGLRDVSGDTVVLDGSSPEKVTLDGASPSVASIAFNGSASDEIAQGSGGTLQLNNGSSSAAITVAAGKQVISAPVALASNVVVSPAAGSQLTISGGISGTGQSLTVAGPGKVDLQGADSYAGGTIVTGGKLIVDNSSAIAAGTSLTVGAGAAALFAPAANAPAATATAAAISSSAAISPAAPSVAASVAAPAALPQVASRKLAGGNVQSPIAPAAWAAPRNVLGPTLPSAPPAVAALVGPSESWFTSRMAADLAWLAQIQSAPAAVDPSQNRAAEIQALDALFAQYDR